MYDIKGKNYQSDSNNEKASDTETKSVTYARQ